MSAPLRMAAAGESEDGHVMSPAGVNGSVQRMSGGFGAIGQERKALMEAKEAKLRDDAPKKPSR